jgi:hypothetical protein
VAWCEAQFLFSHARGGGFFFVDGRFFGEASGFVGVGWSLVFVMLGGFVGLINGLGLVWLSRGKGVVGKGMVTCVCVYA